MVNVLFAATISRAVASNSNAKSYAKTWHGFAGSLVTLTIRTNVLRREITVQRARGFAGVAGVAGGVPWAVGGAGWCVVQGGVDEGGVVWRCGEGCVLGPLCRLRT